MRTVCATAFLLVCSLLHAQERRGISPERLFVFDDASMPAKEFRVLRTTYAPGGQNPKHYHTSHVVFYVLEGSGTGRRTARAR